MKTKTIKNRFAAACEEFDRENSNSIMNLNATISLHESNHSQYKDIPKSVIYSIERLINHTNRISKILFEGTREIDLESYLLKKEENKTEFSIAMEELANLKNKKIINTIS
jgi:hypothetical protein